jgi:hypothetical protein
MKKILAGCILTLTLSGCSNDDPTTAAYYIDRVNESNELFCEMVRVGSAMDDPTFKMTMEDALALQESAARQEDLQSDISKMNSMLNSSEKAKFRQLSKGNTFDALKGCLG